MFFTMARPGSVPLGVRFSSEPNLPFDANAASVITGSNRSFALSMRSWFSTGVLGVTAVNSLGVPKAQDSTEDEYAVDAALCTRRNAREPSWSDLRHVFVRFQLASQELTRSMTSGLSPPVKLYGVRGMVEPSFK